MKEFTENKKKDLMVFWSWNGDMVHEEIDWQLRSFHEQGITAVFLHARAGLGIPYMQKEWFSACEKAIAVASELDMEIWLYDEDGWPSGFAGGKVAALSKDYWSSCVRFCETYPQEGEILFRYNKSDDGYVLDANGNDLFAVIYRDSHYVDLLNPEVTDAFIRFTHEEYKKRLGKYFGGVVKGIFTDEPQVMQPFVYNSVLNELYRKKFGRELSAEFWMLFCDTPEAQLFRCRYYDVVGSLFRKNYTQKIAEWCTKNKLEFTGHFAAEDGLCSFGYNMGVMQHYISMSMPGIDFLGRRTTSPVLLKQLGSVKNQFNKPRVLSETFGCSGWNTSFRVFQYIWAYQAAFGINTPCLHLSAYSIAGIRKRDYPAFFSYQEPWWDDFSALGNSLKNISAFVSEGEPMADTLVISPLTSVVSRPAYAERACAISNAYRTLVENLLNVQVDFDLTDEKILEYFSKISSGKIWINNIGYGIIIISETDLISRFLYDFLCKAQENGVQVVFIGKKPELVHDELYRRLEHVDFDKFSLLQNRRKLLLKYFDYINYSRTLKVTGGFSAELSEDLYCCRRKVDGGVNYFLLNTSCDSQKQVNLVFEGGYAEIARNALTLAYESLPLLEGVGALTLQPMESVMIRSRSTLQNNTVGIGEEVESELLRFVFVKPQSDNVLTLDKAEYRYDNGKFSSEMPVIKLQDEVFSHAGTLLEVKYRFTVDEIPKRLKLAVESGGAEQVFCNGILLNQSCGFFIDKCISVYDITAAACLGENAVSITYIKKEHFIVDTENVFETERNRFCYPIAVENVYVLGDFGVIAKGRLKKYPNYFTVTDEGFVISKKTELVWQKPVSAQGLYFYRGTVIYCAVVSRGEGRRFLFVEDFKGVLLRLFVNNIFVGIVSGTCSETELTSYLTSAENELRLELVVSNRNTLGPHHHQKGEPDMTGIHIFKGERGFEDDLLSFSSPESTWSDDYAFVENGLGRCFIKTYKR